MWRKAIARSVDWIESDPQVYEQGGATMALWDLGALAL
jgi:hypothetical protein